MIKVNIQTLECTREPLPAELRGLLEHTLQNLQTEIDPIPQGLENIEYWPEIDDTTLYDEGKHSTGAETLTPNVGAKTVSVVHDLVLRPVSEVASEKLEEISSILDSKLIPLRGDVSDIQRETWSRFAEGALTQGRNPGSASTILQARADKQGKTIAQIKDAVLAKSEPIDQQLGDLFGQSDILNDQVQVIVNGVTTDEQKIDAILLVEWPV